MGVQLVHLTIQIIIRLWTDVRGGKGTTHQYVSSFVRGAIHVVYPVRLQNLGEAIYEAVFVLPTS